MAFTYRLAAKTDIPELSVLIDVAIDRQLGPLLSPEQLALSRSIMSLDMQLIEDRTYFVVEKAGQLVGCGGWTARRTRYGGVRSTPAREAALARLASDAARIRAMYTHPDFARCGVGRLVLGLCEAAACAAGFRSVELIATPAGEPLYRACGYAALESFIAAADGAVEAQGVRMRKDIAGVQTDA